jgi:YVTN family beta-propeller protein
MHPAAEPDDSSKPAQPKARRRRWRLILIGAVEALVVVAAVIVGIRLWTPSHSNEATAAVNSPAAKTSGPSSSATSGHASAPARLFVVGDSDSPSVSGTLTSIDVATSTVHASLTIGHGISLAITPDGNTAYLDDGHGTAVIPYDLRTNRPEPSIVLPDIPGGLSITPDGRQLFVVNAYANNITIIDTATNRPHATIPTGKLPGAITFSPDGAIAYVVNYSSNNVTPIDTRTDTVGAPIPTGPYPTKALFTPDGRKAYVLNWTGAPGFSSVTPIDTATGHALPAVKEDQSEPNIFAVSPDGKTVYVGSQFTNGLSQVDTSTDKARQDVEIGGVPQAIGLTPDGTTMYVAIENTDSLVPYRPLTGDSGAAIDVGAGIKVRGVMVIGTTAYAIGVTASGKGVVVPVDTRTNKVGKPLFLKGTPAGAVAGWQPTPPIQLRF